MTLDILSAFVQRDMPESINSKQTVLKICGVLLDMLCEIAPEVYKDFATYDNNVNNILHIDTLEPLCRILKVLVLCY